MHARCRGTHIAPSQLLSYGAALREFWRDNPLGTIAEAVRATDAPPAVASRVHLRLVAEGRLRRVYARRSVELVAR